MHLLTIPEVAALTRRSVVTTKRDVAAGTYPVTRIGRRIYVREDLLEEVLDRLTTGRSAEPEAK